MRAHFTSVLIVLCGLSVGCARMEAGSPLPAGASAITGQVAAALLSRGTQGQQHWLTFHPHTTDVIYNGIAPGAHDRIWFAVDGPSNNSGGIAKIDFNGSFTEFPMPGLHPGELAEGADGNLYVDIGNVGRMTPSGQLRVFTIPSGDCICGNGLTLGKDGNVWFSELKHIGYITPAGNIKEYSNGIPSGNYVAGIAYGQDGRVWFTDYSGGTIDALNPSDGTITIYTPPQTCYAHSIVAANDHTLWFGCASSLAAKIGKITTQGVITMFSIRTWVLSEPPHDITIGPDGNLWFAGQATIKGNLVNSINRFDVKTGAVSSYITPDTHHVFAWDITAGPDGNIWLSHHAATINAFLTK